MTPTAEFGEKEENASAFGVWAKVYDKQENPLLALEERYLARILPNSNGRDILDAGCGTGRWLARLARGGPASLCGVDSSGEMLHVAADKWLANTRLFQAEISALPVRDSSTDLAIASFVLSYIPELDGCACELARVIREGGDLFVTDMHLGTATALGWKRGFDTAGQRYRLAVQARGVPELIRTFAAHGLILDTWLEPAFGEAERELFRIRDKEEAWLQAYGRPAIYVLHFRRMAASRANFSLINSAGTLCLRGARCALGPHEILPVSLIANNGVIGSIVSDAPDAALLDVGNTNAVDLHGYLVFPGLVNSHDHLDFALYPRLGSPPYQDAREWAFDIQANEAETIALHNRVPKEVRLWWGGMRNLLCGATTVCQHNPLDPLLRASDFPVRVLAKYGWEHSLAFGKDVSSALARTGTEQPFLIHACEGVNEAAFKELYALDAMGALDARTVLIHGLALDERGAALLNDRRSALIICPSSNDFLFRTTHTRELLRSIQRLALGSDSPLTATGDLLDEIRYVRTACGLHPDELYAMVTDGAASVLRVRDGEGAIRAGGVADLFAVRDRGRSPAERLMECSWRDVELVLIGGHVQLASRAIFERLPARLKQNLTAIAVEDEYRWVRGPVITLLQGTENVLGNGNVRVGGLRICRLEV